MLLKRNQGVIARNKERYDMSTTVEKWYLTHKEFWDHSDEMIRQIIAAMNAGQKYEAIVFAPRGGLPVVYEVISALGSDVSIFPAQITSYHNEKRTKEPRFLPANLAMLQGALRDIKHERILFVDDIRDSGGTQKVFLEAFPGAHTACVYARYQGHGLTYVGHVVGDERWLVFPLEERTINSDVDTHPRPWKARVV